MIDTLRDILAAAYVIGLLLAVVVFLLIALISSQRQTLSVSRLMFLSLSDMQKARPRRKSRKRRKSKPRKKPK